MQQNAEKQLLVALSKFKLARDWVAINGCIQNIKEVCLNFRDEIYETPHTLLLSKTLSQCLSPSLPAGVQSSALDVYSLLFETAGESRLLRDFYIWAPGILQFFHSAGVSQRVTTLKLFSDFFIPLIPSNHRLGPPIILSILPGLTDDGTEVQSLDYQALDTIKRYLGSVQFWRAMFRSALTHPNTRSAFLVFTNKSDPFSEFHDIHNNRASGNDNDSNKNIDDLNDSRLITSLFTVLFNDSNVLIVRSALELFKASYSKLLSDGVKSDLSLKCFNLLSNEDKSIRRRVFQWITENINSKIVHLAVSKAEPIAIKVALEKGDEIKKMVIEKCLTMILSRGSEFDISIFFNFPSFLVDLETLFKSVSSVVTLENVQKKSRVELELISIDMQLRIIQFSPSSVSIEIRSKLLNEVLEKFVNLKKIETNKEAVALKLSELALLLVDSFDSGNEKIKEIGKEAINSIFSDFKNIKTCLQFAVVLLSTVQLDVDYNLLVQTNNESFFCFQGIESLVALSKISVTALITLDENVDKCIIYCWQLLSLLAPTETFLTKSFDHEFDNLSELQILEKKVEVCKILVQIYYLYPSKFAIVLDQHWDSTSVMIFVTYTSEIPLPVLIVAQNKIKKQKKLNLTNSNLKISHFDNFNLLRMICGHSQLLLTDVKRLLMNASNENDIEYMTVIIESLTNLVSIDNKLFIKSMTDSSLISLISQLLTINNISSNLLYSILSISENDSLLSNEVLSEISGLIENYILSNVTDSYAFRLIIPVALFLQDSSVNAFIDLVPKHPSMLTALLTVLEKIPSSDSHFVFIDSLCQRSIELLNNIQSKSFLTSYFDDNSFLNTNSNNNSFITLIDEPLLNDISRLFKLIICRTENEILENRATVKSSTLRRILTSVEDLSNDNCIASLTVSYIQDDANVRYSSLAPKYLPQVLSVAFNSFKILTIQSSMNLSSLNSSPNVSSSPSTNSLNSAAIDNNSNTASSFFASKFIVPFFLSFDNTWKLLFFYALAVTNSARMMQCVLSSISQLVQDNQMAYYIKSLVQVLSYNDSNEKPEIGTFCNLIETLLHLRHPVFINNAEPQMQTSSNSPPVSPTTAQPPQPSIASENSGAVASNNVFSSLLVNIQSNSSFSASSAPSSQAPIASAPPQSPIDIMPVFCSMFSQLHISPSSVVRLILTYQICFPQVSLSTLQVPFTSALSDAKVNQEEVQSIISFLCMLDNKEAVLKKSLFKSTSQSKITLLFTKLFSLCDKSSIQYPFFISKFVSFDPENTDWATTATMNMLSDPQFFQNGFNYLSTSMSAIKSVSKSSSEKFVPLIFELLSKSSSDTGIMWIQMRSSSDAEGNVTRNLKLLSFVILSCDFDYFANRQQSISQQLLHFLSIVETNTANSVSNVSNSGNSSTLNMTTSVDGNNSNAFSSSISSCGNCSIKSLSAFKAFALFMKVMFLRFSSKFIESFLPIITNELTLAFTSEDDNIRAQSEVLLRNAIVTIPALFQFTEFAFIPDLITFPNNADLQQNQRQVWPIIKESADSLLHLTQPETLKKPNLEFDLLREFLESIE